MNNLLYNLDAYIREFDSDVVDVRKTVWNKQDVYEFVLGETCFFPEQGGQTSDTGILTDIENEVEFEVIHAYIKDEVIYHIARCKEEDKLKALGVPKRIHGKINWEERFDKMQNHSGEHLVSGTVHRFFGFDNVGFSLSKDNCTLDFNGTFTSDELNLIEKTVNRAVFENFEVIVLYPDDVELSKIDYRSKKELSGQVRIVEYPGYDVCACCAPHVKRTGEIGLIKIVSAEHFKGGTRITIRCGYRALLDYGVKQEECRKISKILSVPIDEVANAVEKENADIRKLKFDLVGKMNEVLSLKAKEVIKDKNPLIFMETADVNAVRSAVNGIVKESEGICGIFTGNDEKGYSYIISSEKIDCTKVLNILKTEAGAKGGGNAGMIQGNVPSVESVIRDLIDKVNS